MEQTRCFPVAKRNGPLASRLSRSLEVIGCDTNRRSSGSTYDLGLLLVTNRNNIGSYHFQDCSDIELRKLDSLHFAPLLCCWRHWCLYVILVFSRPPMSVTLKMIKLRNLRWERIQVSKSIKTIPGNSRQEFSNGLFPEISGNSGTGIPGGLDEFPVTLTK